VGKLGETQLSHHKGIHHIDTDGDHTLQHDRHCDLYRRLVKLFISYK